LTDTHDFITRVEWEPENDKPNQEGFKAIDEIVTGPIDSFHIERMDNGCYFIALNKGERRQAIWIRANAPLAKIVARTEAE